jgi:hypothetical protein
MTTLSAGTVSIGVKPDTKGFGTDLKSGLLGHTKGVGEGMGSMIMGGLKTMAGPIAAVTAAFSVKHLLEDSMKTFEDLAGSVRGVQRVTGGTAEDVSKMTGAMKLAGIDVTAASGAMTIFSKNLGKAAGDAGKTAAMNNLFGQSIKDANGHVKSMADLLPGLADRFKEMPDGAEKTALATQLFGRSGAQMIPILNKGSDGIAELTDKAEKMGLVLDDTSMNIFVEAKKSAREFSTAITGLKASLGEDLLPVVDAVQNVFRNAMTPVIERITKFLKDHRDDFVKFGEILSDMGKGAEGFSEGLSKITDMVTNFITGGGLTKMITGMIDTRTKLITAIADALPKLIESLANAIVTALPTLVQALLSMIPGLLSTAEKVFTALITALGKVVPQLLIAIANMLPGLVKTLTAMLPQIIDSAVKMFTGLINGLTKVLPELITTISTVVLPQLIKTIVSLIPVLIPAAVQLFLALVTGLTKAIPQIIVAVVKLIPVIVKALIDAIPQIIDAGYQIVVGLAKGIMDNAPTLIARTAKSLGNMLIDSVKGILGIHSPSLVFHEIGGYVTEGMANGITQGGNNVVTAAGKVSADMVERVQANLANLKAAAAQAVTDAKAALADYAASVKSSLSGGLSFGQALSDEDQAKADAEKSGTTFGGSFMDSLKAQADKATKFTDQVKSLVAGGLSKDALQQVLAAGQDAGTRIADELLKGGSNTIKKANDLVDAAKNAAAAAAEAASSAYYAAGVKNAEDQLAGYSNTMTKGSPSVAKSAPTVTSSAVADKIAASIPGASALPNGGTTIVYNAAKNDSISSEQKLVDAVTRASVLARIGGL